MKNTIRDFIKSKDARLLDVVVTAQGNTMIYYRIKGSYPTDVKTKVFYK